MVVEPAEGEASRCLTVGPDGAGERLDRWLARHLSLGRRCSAELVRAGRVKVNGRRCSRSTPLREGAEVHVLLPEIKARPDPDQPLEVCLERNDLVVVYKPSGVPSVPLGPGELGTLAGALLARYPECAAVGYSALEPGLLHRLDTGTSGLLVAARNQQTFAALRAGLSAGRLEKRYLAIVERLADRLPPERLSGTLAPHRKNSRRVVVQRERDASGYPASAGLEILARSPHHLLVALDCARAYRHQLRALLADASHPIIGDELYGRPPQEPSIVATRLALHASSIRWRGATPGPFHAESALPNDLVAVASRLGLV